MFHVYYLLCQVEAFAYFSMVNIFANLYPLQNEGPEASLPWNTAYISVH